MYLRLFGVSKHTGSKANSGHCMATVCNTEDGIWYRYNDSQFGTMNGDGTVTCEAYLHFYQPAKGCLRWAGMGKTILITSNTGTDDAENSNGFH